MNAKEEFLKATEGTEIKCCQVFRFHECNNEGKILLPINYTKDEYRSFLNKLDFEYNNRQELLEVQGLIWLKDGSCFERIEASNDFHLKRERWNLITIPPIPNYLQSNEDIVTIDGIEYEFIEEDRFSCSHCSFRRTALCMTMKCSSKQRLDKKSGYFIKKEIKYK